MICYIFLKIANGSEKIAVGRTLLILKTNEEPFAVKPPFAEEAAGDTGAESTKIAAQLMKNPQVLAALQEKLGSIVGTPSGYIQS